MYSCGHLTWPKDSDPRFAEEADAIRAAEKKSEEPGDDVIGVWNDEDGELLHVVYLGQTFSS